MNMIRASAILLFGVASCNSHQPIGFLAPYQQGRDIVIPYNFVDSGVCVRTSFPMTSLDPIEGLRSDFANLRSTAYTDLKNGVIDPEFENVKYVPQGSDNFILKGEILDGFRNKEIYIQFEYVPCESEQNYLGTNFIIYSSKLTLN